MHSPSHTTSRLPNRLKICMIASTYPRHNEDYAVPWLRSSVSQLVERGHEVTVLAPSFEGLKNHRIDETQVVRFRYSPKCWERLTHEQGAPNRIRNPWYQLLAIPYLANGCRVSRRLAKAENFDLIHVHWPFPHEPIGSMAAKIGKAPLVMTCHGAEFAIARRKPWVAECLKRSLMKADRLIANSSDTAHKIRELCGREADVLPFGSTVEPKGTRRASNPIPRLLFTGRLIQRKGVEYLLRALKIVLKTHPVQLIITGDGDQRERLEALCRDLQLDDAVQFLGFVDNERLNQEYAQCDLWINPSIVDDRGDTEGLGVGAIEAYAHGKAVIASAVGGIPDAVVHNETGLLVPEKDTAALATAIVQLISDPPRAAQLALGGLRLVKERFHWSRITDQVEELYADCIRVASSRRSMGRGPTHQRNRRAVPAPLSGWLARRGF